MAAATKSIEKSIDKALVMKNALYFSKLVVGLIVIAGVFRFWQAYDFIFIPFENDQMEPGFKPKEFYLGRRIADRDQLKLGDVVYYSYPHRDTENEPKGLLFARVVGVPGDRIGFKQGKLYRNGQLVEEDIEQEHYGNDNCLDVMVPRSYVYLLLDNRQSMGRDIYAKDSRFFGPILMQSVIGRLDEN